jgi:hypothetical protein
MARERSVKHTILRSFETLIKGMDPSAKEHEQQEQREQQERQERQEQQKRQERQKRQEPVKPRTIVAAGELLGRKWQVYSDGLFEGETVSGMEAFRDLDHFKSLVEVSPVLRNERSTRDFEQPASEPGSTGEAPVAAAAAADGAAAATAGTDAIGSPSLEHDRAAHPAVAKSLRSHPDRQLGRDLAMAGALGVVLCVAWWFRFYIFDDLHAELLRRGLSENAIRSTNLSIPRSLACFFLNTESCAAMKNWGRFAGRLAYEPAFVWASICALGLGLLLVHIQSRKPRNRTVEKVM